MYGVILWSDPLDRRAVIWCEDQRGLAYYEDPQRAVDAVDIEKIFFDPGDLVEFDVTFEQDKRLAFNAASVVLSNRHVVLEPSDGVIAPFVGMASETQTLPPKDPDNVIMLAAHRVGGARWD
ncbi:hypothetical protein E4Z66_05065 [Aliishimia ponticola]|uniref:Uncharacterized protein n=1 Tax=Aliishimia ponticola TaxID=2499833 RepID=A0A4S4NH16_9RHOB|nr:hypothetical protein [Aliishimia ponticola]THH38929.1 hypothetical protein E4Z66_05065 [Aliishimia ponticola]